MYGMHEALGLIPSTTKKKEKKPAFPALRRLRRRTAKSRTTWGT
jgi:hypothetical protein